MKKFRRARIRDFNAAIEGLQHRIRVMKPRREKLKELQKQLVNTRTLQLQSEIRKERKTQRAST